MSYQTALIIRDVIDQIHRKKYLLPSIQREFVWDTYQIERLFDSLMRDYPISSFLFWHVEKEKVRDFQFYEFLREYHEWKQRHNAKANVSGEEEVTAILDGQQRLTALYVGLRGTYAYKLPRKRYDNELAYPKRRLFLNLLKSAENSEFEYHFSFLTEEESTVRDDDHFWFPVGEILNYKEIYQVNEFMIQNGLFSNYAMEKASFANRALSKLHSIIHVQSTISYYLERNESLDKVLNIFIRINSGGTQLSYSDLLLSIATAQWQERDAREEITGFVNEINRIGEGFDFNKDFVLKSCLVLSDFSDIAFKVDNFNKANMLRIEDNWEDITKAIRLSVNLVKSFGYNRETLTSNNALIPIAYYLKKIGMPDHFARSSHTIIERKRIAKWLVHSLLKRAFSGQPDNVLRPIRRIIQENGSGFPVDKIVDQFKGTNKSLLFSDEDIANLIATQYGQSAVFSVLYLLYPSFDFRGAFHIDHIFPKSLFTHSKLRRMGIPEDKIDDFLNRYNCLPNLQVLEDIPNIEKQDKPFDQWINATFPAANDRAAYEQKHLIPHVDLTLSNFLEFFEKRQEKIFAKLKDALSFTT